MSDRTTTTVNLVMPNIDAQLDAAYRLGRESMREEALNELNFLSAHPYACDLKYGLWPWVSRNKLVKYFASVERAIHERPSSASICWKQSGARP